MSKNLSCGIDFGTSNSTCAISNNEKITLVPLEGDHLTLPSALFFCADGMPLFGRVAIGAYIDGEDGRLMRGLKSVLGTELMSEKTIVGNSTKTFVDILSVYIQNLKDKAEAFAKHPIENAVFGRPVHFHDNAPDADQQSQNILEKIAKSVGFKNIIFQYEPIAAGFAHEQNIDTEKLSLVIDLGGGTSDFTVIKLSNQRSTHEDRSADILGTTGIRVGGTNFDQRLSLKLFMPHLGLGSQYHSEFNKAKLLDVPPSPYISLSEWPRVNAAQTNKAIRDTQNILRNSIEPEKVARLLYVQEQGLGHAFLQDVERTKIDLTSHTTAHRNFARMGMDFNVDVTADAFENVIRDCVDRISASIKECLKLASVAAHAIDLVILTGGSSELPIINRLVQNIFSEADISKENKLSSVGAGLAYNARAIFK